MRVRHKDGGGVYVWRTRKPHAVVGLPIIGRHTGYVGETNRFARRGQEHLRGSDRYQTIVKPKDWADLAPKVYEFPLPDWRWLRLAVERLLVAVLCPVYNVQLQPPWNVRRITPKRAAAQRFARDQFGLTARITATLVRWTVWAALAGAAYMVWKMGSGS